MSTGFVQNPRGKLSTGWGNLWQNGVASSAAFHNAGAPTNGTSGTCAGLAGPGALLADTTNSALYQNTGTKASPKWTLRSLSFISAASTSITVGAGQQYADLGAAWHSLDNTIFAQNANLYFNVAAGTISVSSAVNIQGINGTRCTVQGATPITSTVTSIQSSSGSVGAYSIILNVGSIAGITVGSYAFIEAASGGTSPQSLEGCWKITNVDGVNTRITITSTLRYAPALPSGAVAATLTVLLSVLSFTGCDGIQIWGGGGAAINLSNIVLVGNGAATNGISLQDVGRVYVGGRLGVVGFGLRGIYINYNSQMNCDYPVAVTGSGSDGCFIDTSASFDSPYLISSGNTGQGIYALSGIVRAVKMVICGNNSNGAYASNGGIIFPSTTGIFIGNNGNGALADNNGFVNTTNISGSLNFSNLITPYNISHVSEIDNSIAGNVVTQLTATQLLVKSTSTIGIAVTSTTPSVTYTAVYVSGDGQARVQYRDGSGVAKWEVGHVGSSGTYAYSIYGDVAAANALYIKGSNNYIGTLGVTSPAVPLHVGGAIRTDGTTVAGLIAAATAGAGARQYVTDSTVVAAGNFGAIVAGTGANGVPVYCDGTNWRIG